MTVEKYLRGKFQGIGRLIDEDVLAVAVISPIEARPVPFRVIALNDDVEDYIGESDFADSLTYALSTLYYAMSGATDGGTRSEKRGNRQISIGGKAIDVATRGAWRREGDRLRKLLGCEIEETATESGGMFDATNLRNRR